MAVAIGWDQALAWRMRRHLLDPVGRRSAAEVAGRLCGVQAQVASSAELAIRIRRRTSRPGEVERALRDGRLMKTWAMRGTLHLLRPEEAGTFLSLIAAGRSWERPSWARYFGVTPQDIEALRRAARSALETGPLTREELAAAVRRRRGLRHLGELLGESWGTLLKPLAWQGDLCFGPSRGTRVTFRLPEDASSRWAGVPAPEDAAPDAIVAYFGAYAPASAEAFGDWLAGGYFGKRQLRSWVAALGDRLVEVDVEGKPALVLAEHVDELAATPPTGAVRLLGGFDQFVLGPGTGDGHVTPSARRAAVSRQSGWISPVVLVGGAVRGTWELDGSRVGVSWFREAGKQPRVALAEEVARLSEIVGRPLRAAVSVV
jgi:hypothetical protein